MRFSKRFSRVMAMMLTVMLVVGSFPAQNVLAAEPDATEETAVQEDAAQSEETDEGDDSAEKADEDSDDASDDDDQDADDPSDVGDDADNDSDEEDNDDDNTDDADQSDETETDDSISDNDAEESVSDDEAETLSENEAESVSENVLAPVGTGTIDGFYLDGNGGGFWNKENGNYDINVYAYVPSDEYYWTRIEYYGDNSYSDPKREGYWFTGWYEDAACTKKASGDGEYGRKELNERPENGATLYAGWSDEWVTITYDFGTNAYYTGYIYTKDNKQNNYENATVISAQVPKGEELSHLYRPSNFISSIHYYDEHDELIDWQTSGGESVDLRWYCPTEDVTLYAQYESKIIVTFNANGGYYKAIDESENNSGYVKRESAQERYSKNSYICNDSLKMPLNFDGKKSVVGWYSDAACTQEVDLYKDYACTQKWIGSPTSWYYIKTGTKDFTLYAKWADTKIELKLDPNAPDGYFQDADTFYERQNTKSFGGEKNSYSGLADDEYSVTQYEVYNPKRDDKHYRFTGWYSDPTCKNLKIPANTSDSYTYLKINTTITEDTVWYAGWEEAYKVITFDAGAGTYAWYDFDRNKLVYDDNNKKFPTDSDGYIYFNGIDRYYSKIPYNPEINDDHKVFEGWYDGNIKIDDSSRYRFTSDKTLKARYVDACHVTVNYNGGYYETWDEYGECVHNTAPYDGKVAKGAYLSDYMSIKNPCYENDAKTFMGWYLSTDTEHLNRIYTHDYKPTSDVELVAYYVENFTVTFDAGEGTFEGNSSCKNYTAIEGTVYRYNDRVEVPDDPVINSGGKVFDGWYLDGKKVSRDEILNAVVTGNVTYTARYVNAYAVTFKANGGYFVSTNNSNDYIYKVAEGTSLRGKVPTVASADEHMVFSGWYTDQSCSSEPVNPYEYNVDSAKTLYAGWTECYLLTFHTGRTDAKFANGESTQTIKVVKGTPYRYGDADKDEAFTTPKVITLPDGWCMLPGWYTDEEFTGDRYVFDGESYYQRYILHKNGDLEYFNRIYGFIPTSDMHFYAYITNETVNVIYDGNGGIFSDHESSDTQYRTTLNSAKTQCTVKVPKGITFGEIYKYDGPGRSFSQEPSGKSRYEWAYRDKACNNYIFEDEVIDRDITVYCKWSAKSSSTTRSKVTLHAGDGYFTYSYDPGSREKTSINYYTIKTWNSLNIPVIDDSGRAFSGWYYDEALTKPYPAEYQRFINKYGDNRFEVYIAANVTDLYAAYGTAYTVTLDANGGYFDDDYNRTKNPNVSMRETDRLKCKLSAGQSIMLSDYSKRIRIDGAEIFDGWYTDKACTKKVSAYSVDYYSEQYKPNGNITLYAKWVDYEKPDSVVISGKNSVDIGGNVYLNVAVSPELNNTTVHWYVDSYDYDYDYNKDRNYPAKLDINTGKVTGLAAGYVRVYAEVNGVRSNVMKVSVSNKTLDTSIAIVDSEGNGFADVVDMHTGDNLYIKGMITPEERADVLANTVKWTSSNPAVATVVSAGDGSDGLVTAVGEGETVITATLGKTKATVSIRVTDSVRVSDDTLRLTAIDGASRTFYVVVPSDIDNVDIKAYATEECAVVSALTQLQIGTPQIIDNKKTIPVTVSLSDEALGVQGSEQVYIRAMVETEGQSYEDISVLTISEQKQVGAVTASVADGAEVSKGQKVLLYCDTRDADIYYTTDGTAPTIAANLYTDAIIINGTTTVKAMAVKEGLKDSAVCTFTYSVSDWGDAEEYKDWFENDISNVPDDIWYVIGGIVYLSYPENGITDFTTTYTGSKITFNDQIKVFIGTTRLIENRDYTVSFANNTNALTADAVNPRTNKSIAPYFTIKGKGSYSKTAVFRFTITTEDIDNAVITSESIVPVAYGKSVKLGNTKPKVTYAGKTLTLNKDYVLEYYRNTVEDENQVADPAKELLTEPGAKYIIRVVAKEGGNFAGDMDATVTVVVIDGKDKSYVKTSTLKVGNEKGQAIKLPYFEDAPEELAVYYKADGSVDFEKLFDNSSDEKIPYAFVYAKKPAEPLTYGVDYTVEAATCKDAGKYTFVIKGVEKDAPGEGEIQYTGSKTAALEITGTALSKTKIAGLVTTVEYTGAPITMADLYNAGDKVIIAQNNAADTDPYDGYNGVKWSGVTLYTTFAEKVEKKSVTRYRALIEGVDYTVSCENTGVVGKFTLTFTGKGRYTGVISKTITVKAYNLNDTKKANLIRVTVDNENVQYSKTGAKPAVTVRYGDTVLREGIDYTVTYKNNGKIVADYTQLKESARPTVIVKGKGNYAGSSAAMEGAYFNIVRADVTEAVTLSVSDVVRNPKGKSGYFFVTPKLMDGGKAVTAGKNKDVDAIAKTDYAYYYAEDTVLLDDTRKYAGEAISATDALPDNTLIRVTVKVTISDAEKGSKIRTAESPYKATGAGNTAVLEGYYRFLGEGKDISKMSVSFVKGKTYTFHNGDDVVPVKTEDILISYKTKDANGKTVTEFLGANDFEIASISQNRFLGTATVTLRGKGDFGGSKNLTFKVNVKSVEYTLLP